LGIGDWGLGIGGWAQSPIPNPQSPIPNPQSPLNNKLILNFKNLKKIKIIIKKINKINSNYLYYITKNEYLKLIIKIIKKIII